MNQFNIWKEMNMMNRNIYKSRMKIVLINQTSINMIILIFNSKITSKYIQSWIKMKIW
jgi:hypothetical protein